MADMINCKYCNKKVTPQGLKNHEKNCVKNPANLVSESDSDSVEIVETEIPELQEKVEVPTEEVVTPVIVDDGLVEIVTNQDLRPFIGDRYYTFVKGVPQKVSPNVKDILKRAGMLGAL